MNLRMQSARRAVTLTELLVVLAIISLLATIAIPVYIQKTEQARVAIARQEVKEIAMAQEQVCSIYGFYVPIHLLDNLPNLPSGQTTSAPRDDFDNDPNIPSSNVAVIDPFASLQSQIGSPIFLNSANLTQNIRVNRLVGSWTGPFLNAQRVGLGARDRGSAYTGTGSVSQADLSGALFLDPWGRPYRMYSPLGVIGTQSAPTSGSGPHVPNQSTGLFDLGIDNGVLTIDDQRFDRWAIVSYGRDGVTDTGKAAPGSPLPTTQSIRDDIFYAFGLVPGESFYRAF